MSQNSNTNEPSRREQVVNILADALLRVLIERKVSKLSQNETKRRHRLAFG